MTPSKENNIYDMICIYINASFYHRKINLTNLSYKYVSQNTFLQRNPLFWNPKKKHLPNFQQKHQSVFGKMIQRFGNSQESHSCSFNRLSLMTSDNLDGSSKKSPRKTHPARIHGNGNIHVHRSTHQEAGFVKGSKKGFQ